MTSFNFLSLYTLTVLATSALMSSTVVGAKPVYPHQKAVRQITTQSASCYPLQLADASKCELTVTMSSCPGPGVLFTSADSGSLCTVPAWYKIKEYLDKTYGEGYDTLHFNDPQVCIPGRITSRSSLFLMPLMFSSIRNAPQMLAWTLPRFPFASEVRYSNVRNLEALPDMEVQRNPSAAHPSPRCRAPSMGRTKLSASLKRSALSRRRP